MEPTHIRSYVLRQGRMTPAQRRSLAQHWQTFGIDPEGECVPEQMFSRAGPLTVEIGFGMGDSLLAMAQADPQRNFLGIEVHRPGVGHLLLGICEHAVTNIRLMNIDALTVLERHLPPESVNRLQLFFPDPWPKKRHRKRRLINTEFLDLAARVLEPGGVAHIATDWEEYAEQISASFATDIRFAVAVIPERVQTKYEKRGRQRGHQVFDIAHRRAI
jgi:tRNA (guanine-N7-)-methyltransferase